MALGPFDRACGSAGARAGEIRPQTTRPGSEGRWPRLMAPEEEPEAEGETANRIPSQGPPHGEQQFVRNQTTLTGTRCRPSLCPCALLNQPSCRGARTS
jgi:hypothetical protein